MNDFEKLIKGQKFQAVKEPPRNIYDAMLETAENIRAIREMVEAERKALVADGYPVDLSYSMASDLWAGMWRGVPGAKGEQ